MIHSHVHYRKWKDNLLEKSQIICEYYINNKTLENLVVIQVFKSQKLGK
mgnify:CR=1 FL=1